MNALRTFVIITAVAVAGIAANAGVRAAGAVVDAAAAVDDARLHAGASREWLMAGGRYDNDHFSALTQIDRTTVARLAPRWRFHSGKHGGFEATPIVADGVMYVTTPFDDVVALDAASGEIRWRYHHVLRRPPCCGPANRGAAVAYGRVYIATVDARLIALDARTGTVRWDVPLADTPIGKVEDRSALPVGDALRAQNVTGQTGIFANMAPIVYDGKVVVGVTGVGYGLHLGSSDDKDANTAAVVGFAGDYGHRGFYAAFDASTGKRVWRWFTIPDHGWEGDYREQTPDGAPLHRDIAKEKMNADTYRAAWKTGGGSAWTTPAFDPALGLLYVGVGNPSPQFIDATRPGDNRNTVSLVALDAATGRERWSYQQVPHDVWGYDTASPAFLLDTVVDGHMVPAVGEAGKTGWLYVHDRRTGKLLLRSQPFVDQHNLFAQPTADGIVIEPSAFGGASWSPTAYDAATRVAYVSGINSPMTYTVRTATHAGHAESYTEGTAHPARERSGTVTAIDTQTGAFRWQRRMPQPMIGGSLATAGGLVFAGEGNGSFDALDATDGTTLWSYACGAGVNAPPITYEIDGTQYVAVAAGGNALLGFSQGDTLEVFALPKAP